MKNRLSDADYAQLLSCIEGIHRCRRIEDFPKCALAELRKLVECKMACYAELDYARQRAVHEFDPPMKLTHEWFAKLIQDHPVLNYFKDTGDGQALKISDFLNVQEFHRLPLYREAFRLTSVEDEIGFGVQAEPRFVLGFAFHRMERSFTERDRTLLNLIRPHVIQAYLHLEELAGYEELQRDLRAALRENGLGLIILNGPDEITHATPGALESLANYLSIPEGAAQLPSSLARWAFAGDGDGKNSAPFVVSREPSRLIVRRVRQEHRLMLLLSEENSAASAERLARFHLTPRELEVLRWIAEGKSNFEIAVILGVSTGTAKMHVEHILAKLGADNRTSAATMLGSLGF